MGNADRVHNRNTAGTDTERARGLSVKAAGARLGVSERAIRARIRRGTLAAWGIEGKRGTEWRVSLDAIEAECTDRVRDGSTKGTEAEQGGTGTASPSQAWEAERAALIGEVAWLRGQVEEHQRHTSDLARLLESEQHQRAALEARIIRALPAPVPEPEGVTIEQDPQPAEVTPEPRRPWWRFGR